MFARTTLAVFVLLTACNGGGDGDGDGEGSDTLQNSTGTVDGSLAYGDDETITFASGIAMGDSFFHGDHDVIVLTQWGEASCDSVDSNEWEGFGDGYKLDIAHDDGAIVEEEVILWDCVESTTGYGSGCGGVEYPVVSMQLDQYDRERGGRVKATITVNEPGDFLSGTLAVDVIYCGEW